MSPTLRFLLVILISTTATAQWSPRDVYRIDCGAISNSTIDGITWQPDSMASGGQIASNSSPNSSNPIAAAAPYPTARVFTTTQSYNFPVSPGRHWIRLHFMPFATDRLDPSNARFSVSVGSHFLLLNASISDEIRRQQQDFIVKEFSILASGSTLSIVFDPSSPASFAFVNGIEVVSMAHDALASTVSKISLQQQSQPQQSQSQLQQQEIDLVSSLTQTMYRLNVGGPLVAASNDSALQGRTWVPDDPYITGVVKGTPATPAVGDIAYPSGVPEYIAPRGVYGTARTLGSNSNTANNLVNISWLFGVESGYSYYVRLHFAEIVYSSPLQRIFSVYIDNRTAIRGLDLMQLLPVNTPYFKDYLVDAGAGTTLRLQIGPTPSSGSEFPDAILNGLEIFKLNDSAGNVGGNPAGFGVGSSRGGSRNRKTVTILGAVAGSAVGLLVLLGAAVAVCLCRGSSNKKQPRQQQQQQQHQSWQPLHGNGNSHSVITSSSVGGSPRSVAGSYYYAGSIVGGGGGGRYFTFQELFDATDGFDESRLVGVGGFGRVYKGELDGGTLEVAIKRGSPRSEQGQAEFQAEIELLSKLRHRHLVSLIGYCDEQEEMILVYEYMARGSLRSHLYGNGGQSRLSWKQRLEAVVGAARGLHYLHTGADHSRAVIHRDVKTTNILLDEHWVAKVSDFGLSKTGPMLDQTHVSTAVKGSFGYLDPEYFRRQQLTDKSDVYSFGVVLVEVMCSRPAIDPSLPREQVNMAEWAMAAKRRGALFDIVDPTLVAAADPASLSRVADIAEKCLAEQGVDRPSMGHVLWSLEAALHMQEAAEQQQPRSQQQIQGQRGGAGTAAAGAGAGAGAVEMTAVPQRPTRQSDTTNYDDSTFSYTEDASASAVFSQLVNPQGR